MTNVWFHIPDGNKQRHQLRKTISVEKKALYALYVCIYTNALLKGFVFYHIFSGSTEAFTEKGREGLLCVLKRRWHKVQAQQAAAGLTYSGTATMSLDDSSAEEENMESYFFTDEEL